MYNFINFLFIDLFEDGMKAFRNEIYDRDMFNNTKAKQDTEKVMLILQEHISYTYQLPKTVVSRYKALDISFLFAFYDKQKHDRKVIYSIQTITCTMFLSFYDRNI